MGERATVTLELAQKAASLGQGLKVRTMLGRLADIDGAQDPDLIAKLGALDPTIEDQVIRRLCDIIIGAP